MQAVYLEKLILENYRNFAYFEVEAANDINLLIGENGIGKTNILEAISLFSPGRGLRGAKFDEICKSGADNWATKASFQSKLGPAKLECNFKLFSSKRLVQYNQKKIPSSELCNFVNMIWLTPQMEGIFLEGASARRKFLDRIVYNFYPNHAAKINEYEHYQTERIKLLQQDFYDEKWLKILESKMATLSISIADQRIKALQQLQIEIAELDSEFPRAVISIDGGVENGILKSLSEDEIYTYINFSLYNSRMKDKFSGRTGFGIHKSDFIVIHKEKNNLAKFCSTGEQKAMLISIILAQINATIRVTSSKSSILLLDEVFVHLDDRRKEYLIDFFKYAKLQTWITATDLKGLDSLKNAATTNLL